MVVVVKRKFLALTVGVVGRTDGNDEPPRDHHHRHIASVRLAHRILIRVGEDYVQLFVNADECPHKYASV